MELVLWRTYYPTGTNGNLYLNGLLLFHTIELPWKDNEHKISCVPEGRYELVKRYSQKFGWHLQLKNVKDRDLILIHPANCALKELKGCIAPVSILKAAGIGLKSRIAFEKIKAIVYSALSKKKQFFLTIKSNSHVNLSNRNI